MSNDKPFVMADVEDEREWVWRGMSAGSAYCMDWDRLRATVSALEQAQAQHRLAMQEHDCTYGDTPGCVHCTTDRPCTMHRLEQAQKDCATEEGWLSPEVKEGA